MKPNPFLKSTLRQPLRTALMLLLVGFISFAFISRAAEYLIIYNETERISKFYRPIGKLSTDMSSIIYSTSKVITNEDGFNEIEINASVDLNEDFSSRLDVSEGAALVAESRYLDFSSMLRECGAETEDIYNIDTLGFSTRVGEFWSSVNDYFAPVNTNKAFLYGTLTKKEFEEVSDKISVWYFDFEVDELVAGFSEYAKAGGKVKIFYIPEEEAETSKTFFEDMAVGERYFFQMQKLHHSTFPFRGIKTDFISKEVEPGKRFINVPKAENLDFDRPENEYIKNEIALLNENLRTIVVRSAKDLTALPEFQAADRLFYLTDGRLFTIQDNLDENHVCVINDEFAEKRGLKIGDRIPLKLRKRYGEGLGITSYYYSKEFGGKENVNIYEREFEIIGFFKDAKGIAPNLSAFFPDSYMPDEFKASAEGSNYSDYSFTLKSVFDKEAFIDEYRVKLADLGITLEFVADNSEAFVNSTKQFRQSVLLNAVIFSLLLILALVLTAFIFYRQRRRDLAIASALGMPKREAVRKLIIPLAVIGAAGAVMGGVPAWNYSLASAGEVLSSIETAEEVSTSISPLWLIGLCFAVLFLLISIALIFIGAAVKRSTLGLLQGGMTAKRAKPMKNSAAPGALPESFSPLPGTPLNISVSAGTHKLPEKSPRVLGALMRYIFRKIIRSRFKSILGALVAVAFILALGWINYTIASTREKIDALYTSITVEGEITTKSALQFIESGEGFIYNSTLQSVLDSGFVQNSYLEALAARSFVAGMKDISEVKTVKTPWSEKNRMFYISLLSASDQKLFFETTGKNVQINYADGYSEDYFYDTEWTRESIDGGEVVPLIIHEDMMSILNTKLGGKIYLGDSENYVLECVVAGTYSGMVLYGKIFTLPILVSHSLLAALEKAAANTVNYSSVKLTFDPSANRELLNEGNNLREIVENYGAGAFDLQLLLWDEELRMAIEPMEKNIELLSVLYPVTVAVSTLIAIGLSVLLMFQNTKEAAIMRVLGSPKRRVRFTLCAEQVILCAIGLLLGTAVMTALWQGGADIVSVLMYSGLYLAGSLFGAVAASLPIINKRPIELLQVKE